MRSHVPIIGLSLKDLDESILKSKIKTYLSEKKTISEIARILGMSELVLKTKIKSFGIPLKKGYNSKYSFVDKDYFEKNNKLSKKELCEKLNCHYNTLRRLLKKYDCLEMFEVTNEKNS